MAITPAHLHKKYWESAQFSCNNNWESAQFSRNKNPATHFAIVFLFWVRGISWCAFLMFFDDFC